MSKVVRLLASEPLRVRIYSALVALLPVLVAFGVDITDKQSASVIGLAYAVLIGATELSRQRVTPSA